MDSRLIFQNIIRFILLILFQILVLNNISFGGYAIPFLYILAILMLPVGIGNIPMLIIAFCTGLCIDLFSNMLGFHAFSCTLIAFCRILFADRILTRDEKITIDTPSIYATKPQYYIAFSILLTAIFFLSYFLIELFDSHNLWRLLLTTVLSTLLTCSLMYVYQLIFIKKKNK